MVCLILSTIDGMPVAKIADSAFSGYEKLASLTLN